VDIPTFVYVMKTTDGVAGVNTPVFDHFQETVFPRPVGEEYWKTVAHKNAWKEKAAFLALNFKARPNFFKVIEALYPPSVSDVYSRVRDYAVGQHAQEDIAHDMGVLISQVRVPATEMVIMSKDRQAVPLEVKATLQEEEEPRISKNVLVLSEDSATKKWENLLPRMEAYRKRAGLNATFPPSKIAKQMIYAAMGTPLSAIPPSVMGPYQKTLTPLLGEEERAIAMDAIDAFASIPMHDANESPYLVAFATLAKNHNWKSRHLLKQAISVEGALDSRACARLKKGFPTGPAQDAVVIKAIENLA
jgi:hypothetical protein